MKVAIIAIGMPGAGKTSLLKPFAEREGFAYVNKDDIRMELTGDPADQSLNAKVWKECRARAQAALDAGQSIVLDATYTEAAKRREVTAFVRAHGATQIIGVFVDVAPDVAKARNRARERSVPERVIDWMHRMLREQPPSLEDGFDALLTTGRMDQLERLVTRGG